MWQRDKERGEKTDSKAQPEQMTLFTIEQRKKKT